MLTNVVTIVVIIVLQLYSYGVAPSPPCSLNVYHMSAITELKYESPSLLSLAIFKLSTSLCHCQEEEKRGSLEVVPALEKAT